MLADKLDRSIVYRLPLQLEVSCRKQACVFRRVYKVEIENVSSDDNPGETHAFASSLQMVPTRKGEADIESLLPYYNIRCRPLTPMLFIIPNISWLAQYDLSRSSFFVMCKAIHYISRCTNLGSRAHTFRKVNSC